MDRWLKSGSLKKTIKTSATVPPVAMEASTANSVEEDGAVANARIAGQDEGFLDESATAGRPEHQMSRHHGRFAQLVELGRVDVTPGLKGVLARRFRGSRGSPGFLSGRGGIVQCIRPDRERGIQSCQVLKRTCRITLVKYATITSTRLSANIKLYLS
uniref:Uncharacterized protein n=1 Tax=Timema douglasi TaxID=61478 RepID=A0A7R8ZA96_TIMDO|nr:unnamed protein product [Timema douglasi]